MIKYKQANLNRLNHRPSTIIGGYKNINKEKIIIIYCNQFTILSKPIIEDLNKFILNLKNTTNYLSFNHSISNKGILVRQGGGKGKDIKECMKLYKGKIIFISKDFSILNLLSRYSCFSYYTLN